MGEVYAQLRDLLRSFQREADDRLDSIADDELHGLVGQAAKAAALAVIRIDRIDQAAQQQG